jgi:integrase
MHLTEDSVRRRKRPTSGQEFDWDELVSGFGVRYTPTRTSFVVQWRDPTGKKPRESLRPHWPQLTVLAAREIARKRLAQVVAIADAVSAQETRVAMRSWFERKTETARWRPRYRAKIDTLISTYVEGVENPRVRLTPTTRKAIEEFGHRPVASVTRTDLMRIVDGIKPGAAEQLMAIVSSFYNDMVDRGVEIPNPARNRLRLFGGRSVRSRTLTDSEFLTLWRALEGEGDPALGAFTTLAFTGCRRREATQMRWSEVDLEGSTWTLPPERRKTGRRDPDPFVMHLHPRIVEMLKRQPVLTGSPFVFWGRRDHRPFDFHYALMKRLQGLGIQDWRLHDVRRYVRSGMAKLGVSQMVAELCLGHRARPGLVAVYDQHTYSAETREAWQRWGDHLVTLIAASRA